MIRYLLAVISAFFLVLLFSACGYAQDTGPQRYFAKRIDSGEGQFPNLVALKGGSVIVAFNDELDGIGHIGGQPIVWKSGLPTFLFDQAFPESTGAPFVTGKIHSFNSSEDYVGYFRDQEGESYAWVKTATDLIYIKDRVLSGAPTEYIIDGSTISFDGISLVTESRKAIFTVTQRTPPPTFSLGVSFTFWISRPEETSS